MSTVYAEHDHLGGYAIGGDDATFYPALWTWLVSDLGVRSVLDIGCGEGHAVAFFATLLPRSHVLGLDGVAQPEDRIQQVDFTKGAPDVYSSWARGGGPTLGWGGGPTLGWCCEFVEHVEEQFVPNIVSAFRQCDIVLLTHADPGQPGYHHVNCRSSEYWKGVMAGAGFLFDAPLTATTRARAAKNPSPWNHYVRSGMAFIRS